MDKKFFSTQQKLLNAIKKNNENYYVKHTWRNYVACNRDYLSKELLLLLKDPDAYIQKNILKADKSNTTTVGFISVNNRNIIIKRYNLKHFTHRLKRALQPSRAAHCWKKSHQLVWFGIATPKPIAIIEKRWGIFRKEAYFIYEYIAGEEGFTAFRDNLTDNNKIRAKKTAQLIEKLFSHNFSHGDMKASNFIYHHDEPYFIDLDAVQRHRFKYSLAKKSAKEIKRFLDNWKDADLRAFFKNCFFVSENN